MRIKLLLSGVVAAGLGGLMAGSAPSVAHHAFAAEFDGNRPVNLTGPVTRVEWINPHAWIHIDVKNTDGTTTGPVDNDGDGVPDFVRQPPGTGPLEFGFEMLP